MAQELWPLITRCMDNVAARRSVPASLEVLRRAIATLPAHEAKTWFGGSRSKENRWVTPYRPYHIVNIVHELLGKGRKGQRRGGRAETSVASVVCVGVCGCLPATG